MPKSEASLTQPNQPWPVYQLIEPAGCGAPYLTPLAHSYSPAGPNETAELGRPVRKVIRVIQPSQLGWKIGLASPLGKKCRYYCSNTKNVI